MKTLLMILLFAADWIYHEVMSKKANLEGTGKGRLYAKFTPGAIVSEIRGKIASTVFSRNKGGAVIRNRIKPINRRSIGQSTRRQVLGSLASAWRGLTQTQRNSWISASNSFPIQDSLGQTIYLSGEQLYIRFNANLILIGETEIDTAPAAFAFEIFTLSFTAEDPTTSATLSVVFSPSPMTTGNTLAIYATPNVSPGIDAPNQSAFRFIGQIDPTDTTPADMLADFQAVFGDPIAGQKIFLEARPIATASGQPGTPLRAQAIVTVST